MPQPDVDALFDSWDPSGDGTIDFKELQKALRGEGAAVSAVAEEGWGLTKRLREAERAAKAFSQVAARLPELVGQTADLVVAKEAKGEGSKRKKSSASASEDNKPAKVEEVGKPTGAKGEKMARVCLDTFLDACLQTYFRLEKEEAEQIVAAFHSWDADGDGSLDYDEFREMAAYSNPTLPPKTMMRIYKAATPDGGSNLNVLKFSQVMLENGLSLQTRPPDSCFDANGQLKPSEAPGGSAVAASTALMAGGKKMNAGQDAWARMSGRSFGRIKLMMNLRELMIREREGLVEEGGEETALSDAVVHGGAEG